MPRAEAAPLAGGEFYAVDLCRLRPVCGRRAHGRRSAGPAMRAHSLMLEVRTVGGRSVPRAVHRPLRRRGRRGRRGDARAAGARDRAVTFTVLTLFPGLFEGFLGELDTRPGHRAGPA
ncbi:MAG: hypothetical protein MZU91_14475 [Desulfosudis oleivorans]|nr:hypothetical protein [Desulfosudis oleivorans]